jgi:hypothetical protein
MSSVSAMWVLVAAFLLFCFSCSCALAHVESTSFFFDDDDDNNAQSVATNPETETFGIVLNKMLNATVYNITDYELSITDFYAMVATPTAASDCHGPPTPTGYLTVSLFADRCYSTDLGYQFSYPVGVCVNYGFVSEKLTVDVLLFGRVTVTTSFFAGGECQVLLNEDRHTIVNNICHPPYQISYSATLPSTGQGLISA